MLFHIVNAARDLVKSSFFLTERPDASKITLIEDLSPGGTREEAMRTVHKKSPVPVYGIAALWLLWAVFLPLYKLSHFLILAAASAGVYLLLRRFFPGHDETVEVPPEPTGDEELDALLAKGREAVKDYAALSQAVRDPVIREKTEELGGLTGQIFGILEENRELKSQVKRFADYFLPAPLKLLRSYRQLEEQNVSGENIDSSMGRIAAILDTTIEAYKKEIDALFEGKALDIETDIQVLEQMLKREGLTAGDF